MYHVPGAISAVSLLTHLAAAVEVKPGMPKNRLTRRTISGNVGPRLADRSEGPVK